MVLDNLLTELGMKPPISHLKRVESYINDRKEFLGLDNSAYLQLLKEDRNEYHEMLDRITINETYLFREQRHFDLLIKHILPTLKGSDAPLRVWSAACSTGEEAISLYLVCKHLLDDNHFKVTASDINNHSLELFRKGRLSKNSFRIDGEKYHHLIPNREKIDNRILEDIEILNINLFDLDKVYINRFYDIIFLRNAIIYFTPDNKSRVIDLLVKRLKPGGCLFVSVTEVPFIDHKDLKLYESFGCYYFQKELQEVKKIVKEEVKTLLDHKMESASKVPFSYIRCLEYCSMTNSVSKTLTADQLLSKEYKTSLAVTKILGLIDNNDKKFVEVELKKIPDDTPLKYYLSGYYLYVTGEQPSALIEFNRCLTVDESFWPASFYLSSITQKKEDIKKCIHKIESYIDAGKRYFDILLDGFDARYFKNICNNWKQ